MNPRAEMLMRVFWTHLQAHRRLERGRNRPGPRDTRIWTLKRWEWQLRTLYGIDVSRWWNAAS